MAMAQTSVRIEPEADADELAAPRPAGRARGALIKRLADVVCLPSSRVNAFERSMTADLLVEMLREAEGPERARVARRLAKLTEVPDSLLRLLLRDHINVARWLLADGTALSDLDLLRCVKDGRLEHRRLIAARRGLTEVVTEALAEAGEGPVTEILLRNTQARLSPGALEMLVGASRENPGFVPGLLRRPELRPSHAYIMFWWAEPAERRVVLQRFALSREVLQDATGDVFPVAAAEGWQDPLVRKALQFIERRQRNRAAVAKSPYDGLEDAVSVAQNGLTAQLVAEISYLSGLKPKTGAKILTDPGGEPVAILCKATGLPRQAVRALWRALRKPEVDGDGRIAPALEQALETYDRMATDRAQTVLRYWNWALTSALTPALVRAIRDGDEEALDEYSAPQRAAMLALAGDYGS